MYLRVKSLSWFFVCLFFFLISFSAVVSVFVAFLGGLVLIRDGNVMEVRVMRFRACMRASGF